VENNKFIIKNENASSTEFQLSFEDFKSLSDNKEVTAKIPYVDYLLLDGKGFEFPTKRYFALSLLVHSALLATVLFYTLNPDLLPQKPQKELITIDLDESSKGLSGAPAASDSASAATPEAAPVAVPAAATVAPAPAVASTPNAFVDAVSEPVVVSKPPVAHKAVIPKPLAAKASKPKVVKSASAHSSSPVKTFEPANSIDDIAVPALAEEASSSDVKNTAPNLDEIKGHLDEIDEQDNQKIIAANQELETISADQSNALENESTALQDEDAKLESLAEARKNKLAEQRNALAAAHAAAIASQKAEAAKAAAAAKQAQNGKGNGNGSGDTAEGDGSSAGTSALAGAGVGDGNVRKLEDLRQMPGNQKPEYDTEERVKGLSGSIVLYGFVTKEGRLSQFKMIQSTGHRSLDKKTLIALKKWKFYPGQEGWVELPFKWDLKGGVQQKPTLLKRR
jgi:TonB family protein